MATKQHVVTGEGAPIAAPPSLGAHYIATDTHQQWYAKGVATAADWVGPVALATSPVAIGDGRTTLITDPDHLTYVWAFTAATPLQIQFPEIATLDLTELKLVAWNTGTADVTITHDASDGVDFAGADMVAVAGKITVFRFWSVGSRYLWTLVEALAI